MENDSDIGAKGLPSPTAAEIRRLMAVAAGREPADQVIRRVDAFNVHLPRIEPNVDIALVGDRIAAIGPDLVAAIGPATEVLDGTNRLATPGLIDAHTHLDGVVTVRRFAPQALISGNTTAISETAMIAGAAGIDGIHAFMDEAKGIPLRVLFTVPPMVPPFPELETSAGLSLSDLESLLDRPDVMGLGESYWRPAEYPGDILERFAAARRRGKHLEGHAAGARGYKLQSFRAGGITSCHEAITTDEARQRLALGMAAMIREGFVRAELPAMAELAADSALDGRRLILCSDTCTNEMLLHLGIMNELVRRAVKTGFAPLRALQMVTLNPADYFGLSDLGRLDPGCLADIVLFDSLETLNPKLVMVGGRIVAENGRMTIDIPEHRYPEDIYGSIKLMPVRPEAFAIPAPLGRARIRAVGVFHETVTKEDIIEVDVQDGYLAADPALDLCKIAVFDRHEAHPKPSLAMARGLGLKAGAAASSILWDDNNIFVAGMNDDDMATAANRVIEMQGGMAAVSEGRVLAELSMPVAGVMSDKLFQDFAEDMDRFDAAMHGLGCSQSRPFLTMQVFCFTGLPVLRLTDRGLVDIRRGKFVSLFAE